MKKNKKTKRVLVVILLVGVLLGLFYFKTKPKLKVVSVVGEINGYNYTIESNTTRIYKKYYKELEEELKDNKVDEKKYASLIAKLFIIDYYTLDNKITNKHIGGVQFIHSSLKDDFIKKASETIYKYVENNLYGNRKQKLPEVNMVTIKNIKEIKYENKNYKDDLGYEVNVEVDYVKKYGYPQNVTLKIIHEENKLVIVEIK